MTQIAKHIIFKGSIQGVGFRFTVMSVASRCKLAGFVRNLSDGSVEMSVQGSPQDVEDCINSIKETYESSISETKVNQIPPDPGYTDFKITF